MDKEFEQRIAEMAAYLTVVARDMKSMRAKYIELLTRVEALEEKLHGPKPGPITADDLMCLMDYIYSKPPKPAVFI